MSNLVGLDEQVSIDGNDDIEKSPVLLSQAVAKFSSSKGKRQSQLPLLPSSSQKRPLDSHRNTVSGVNDRRLHKRGAVQNEYYNPCVTLDPETLDHDLIKSSNMATQPSATKNMVTPSPHPHIKHQNSNTHIYSRNDSSSFTKKSEMINRSRPQPLMEHRSSNSSLSSARIKRAGPHISRSSWFQEKSQQKTAQQTAFSE